MDGRAGKGFGIREVQTQVRDVMGGLLDRIALLVFTLGTLTIAASIYRVYVIGWHPNVISNLVSYGLVVLLMLARQRLPLTAVVSLLLATMGATAIANYLTLGLVSPGAVILIAVAVVTGVFFSLKVALVTLGGGLLIVALVGVGTCTGALATATDANAYIRTPQAWVNDIAVLASFGAALLASVDAVQRRLASSIAELKDQSAKLREGEAQFRLLAENSSDVIFVQDLDLKILYASPSAERLFGYTGDEILTLSMKDYMTAASLDRALESFGYQLAKAHKEQMDVPLLEFEYVRKDGSTFWGELRASFVRDEDGNVVRTQGVLRDIDERKRGEIERRLLEEKLHQSEKMQVIGQITGGIAHDFNNQLSGIMGFAELLAMKLHNDDELKSYADSIASSARHSAELTGKLLAYARKGPQRSEVVDLHEVIDEVIAIIGRSFHKNIRIAKHLKACRSLVLGDPSELQNALLNMALNARDAMPHGGELRFATDTVKLMPSRRADASCSEQKTGYLLLEVADDGVGMERKVMDRVFEPFFTTKEPGQGIGMGLAAAYGTVRRQGGCMFVESALDRGSRFQIFLPLSDKNIVGQPPSEEPVPMGGQGHVLVIDDEHLVGLSAGKMLESLGYQATVIDGARIGIDTYAESPSRFDAVLLDVMMPELTGYEVYQRLKKIDPAVNVVLFSGYSADENVQNLVGSGDVAFLKKPFDMNALSKTIAQVL